LPVPLGGTTPMKVLQVDTPWNCLILSLVNTGAIKGRKFMRGLPDDWVTFSGGQILFEPSAWWNDEYTIWRDMLREDQWGFMGRIPAKRLVPDTPVNPLAFRRINEVQRIGIKHRQTGRPFDSPRGRAPARVAT